MGPHLGHGRLDFFLLCLLEGTVDCLLADLSALQSPEIQ